MRLALLFRCGEIRRDVAGDRLVNGAEEHLERIGIHKHLLQVGEAHRHIFIADFLYNAVPENLVDDFQSFQCYHFDTSCYRLC